MLTVTAVKNFPGREYAGVSCKVCWCEKHVADFIDYGDGSGGELTALAGYAKLAAAYRTKDDLDDAIDAALTAFELYKKAKAVTQRGALVFRVPMMAAGSFYKVKTTDRAKTMDRLRKEYHDSTFFVARGSGYVWVV